MTEMFSTGEKNDLIQVLDEWLNESYSYYMSEEDPDEDSYRHLLERVAKLYFVFTASDWEHPTRGKITTEGRITS